MVRDKLVVVFGGGGFVGRYVAQALLARGARVRIAQRDPRRAAFLKIQGGLGQTQFVAADVTRPDSVARAIAGADMAVNLVGAFANMAAVQADGAGHVAQAARDAGLSALVHVSAIGADGASPALYGRTKAAGEAAVLSAFPTATILRPSIVFGAEDAFTNRFAAMIAKLPAVPVLRGAARFQPVHAPDVAEAAVRALEAPGEWGGRTLAIGGPDVMTLRDIHLFLAREVARAPRLIDVPDDIGALLAALPLVPITRDQWAMLGRDTVVGDQEDGLAAMGIAPTPMAVAAPAWLVRHRRQGRFARRQPA